MSNNKQTAVEWLVEQIKNDQNQKALSAKEWLEVIEQVKEMEKQQIMDAHNHGFTEGTCFGANPILGYKFITAQQYYIETYGKL